MAAEPLAGRWRRCRGAALADDFVAALIVTILLLPQSLAYAMLAGLPPVVGARPPNPRRGTFPDRLDRAGPVCHT